MTVFHDARVAVRSLGRSPIFLLVAAISIALGIGANAVVFGLVNALLLKPLPVRSPSEMVRIGGTRSGNGFSSVSYAEFRELQEGLTALDGLIANQPNNVVFSTGANPALEWMELVSGNYFDVLGVSMARGRGFIPEEDSKPGTHPVLVLSWAYWRSHLGGADVLGRPVRLNGKPFTIVGIAPQGFRGTFNGFDINLWVPVMMQAQALPQSGTLERREDRFLMLMGRLRPGVTRQNLQAQLDTMAERFRTAYPESSRELGFRIEPASGVHPFLASLMRTFLSLLMGMMSVVLLIACANVANMMLARASARQKEMAVRRALGATRRQLIQPFLLEGMFIAALGGTFGLMLASWATQLLANWHPNVGIPIGLDFSIDANVVTFTVLISAGTALLFSLLPALRVSSQMTSLLKESSGAVGPRRSRIRSVMVIAQVAMSTLLLFGAGLLLRSLLRSRAADPGFDAEGVVVMTASPELLGYDETRGRALWNELLDRSRSLPTVSRVALGLFIPLGDRGDQMTIGPEGGRPESFPYTFVSRGYFDTLRIPLIAGRDFAETDVRTSEPVAVISEAMANQFWPNADPLGRPIRIVQRDSSERFITVIGVTRNIKISSLGETPRPLIYLPFSQWYRPDMVLFVRGERNGLEQTLSGLLHQIEPDLPAQTATMMEKTAFSLIPLQLAGSIMGAAGAVGLFLAATGVFGVVAFIVSRQARDIAIRMALGADRRRVRRTIVFHAYRLTIMGMLLGLGLAAISAQLLRGLLYGVGSTDPVALAAVIVVFTGVSVLASWLPARRASLLDPAILLREE
jgi:putative ABC transport system permease protein